MSKQIITESTPQKRSRLLLKKVLEIDLYASIPCLWRAESPAAKAAFFWALIIGFISHLFIYTGRYFGDHDMGMISVVGQIHGDYMHGHGRWLSAIMTHVNYTYILPLVSGLYVSFFLAAAAFFVCKILKIHSKACAVLVGILMVTFPSISNTNLFLYDTANYHLAALLAVLAVYVTMKYRFGFIAGGLLLMCCLAIYQAMFNVACILCLSVLITAGLDENFHYKDLRNKSIRFFLLGCLGGAFYSLSLVVNERFFGHSLGGYRGMSFEKISNRFLSVKGMANALRITYASYMDSLLGGDRYMLMPQLKFAYILLFALMAMLLAAIIIKRKVYKQFLRLLLLGLFILMIPLAANFSNLIAAGPVSAYMMYAFVFTFILGPILAECVAKNATLIRSILAACIMFVAINWIIVNNVYYLQAWFFNQTTRSATTRIAARVEEQLAYSKSGQIAYFSGIPNEYLTEISNEFTEHGTWRGMPLNSKGYGSYFIHMESDGRFGHEMLVNNLVNLHGVNVSPLQDDALREKIREHILANNVPPWPLEGSVATMEDVIVINFGMADVVYESEGEASVFRARHYMDADPVAQTHEYHWQLFRNGALVHDAVSASNVLYIEPHKAYGAYTAWVTVQNKQTDYAYPLAHSERLLLGVPTGGNAADILPAYLSQIKDDNHIIIISAKDEASTAFTENMAAAFRALGLTESLVDKYRHSYAAIVDGDEVLFEDVSQEQISHGETIGNTQIDVKSAGFDAGDTSAILIDAVEYSPNMRGINIVVYDKVAGAVVDAVNFDTYTAP